MGYLISFIGQMSYITKTGYCKLLALVSVLYASFPSLRKVMLMDVWRLRFRGKEFISLDWTGWESTGSVKVSRDINKCTPGKQPKAVITETSLQLELGTFLCCASAFKQITSIYFKTLMHIKFHTVA
ncbi:hypothetical protein Leryth_024272 [Lithospermum erythrorhizon]|nr:hypothetical protein Leryth_024272 [Lithospermum erythrorhizon]